MAMNQLYPEARHIAVAAPEGNFDIVAGMPVVIGGIAGVAKTDAKPGEQVTLWLDGSYEFTIGNTQDVKPGTVVSSFFNEDGIFYNPRHDQLEDDPTLDDYLEVALSTQKSYNQFAPFGVVVRVTKEAGGSFLDGTQTMARVEVIPFGIHHPPIVPDKADS